MHFTISKFLSKQIYTRNYLKYVKVSEATVAPSRPIANTRVADVSVAAEAATRDIVRIHGNYVIRQHYLVTLEITIKIVIPIISAVMITHDNT